MSFKINEIWAYITVDPKDGDEGIPAFSTSSGMMLPMVCADKRRVISLIPAAEAIAKANGVKIKLVRFYGMEVIEEDIAKNKLNPELL